MGRGARNGTSAAEPSDGYDGRSVERAERRGLSHVLARLVEGRTEVKLWNGKSRTLRLGSVLSRTAESAEPLMLLAKTSTEAYTVLFRTCHGMEDPWAALVQARDEAEELVRFLAEDIGRRRSQPGPWQASLAMVAQHIAATTGTSTAPKTASTAANTDSGGSSNATTWRAGARRPRTRLGRLLAQGWPVPARNGSPTANRQRLGTAPGHPRQRAEETDGTSISHEHHFRTFRDVPRRAGWTAARHGHGLDLWLHYSRNGPTRRSSSPIAGNCQAESSSGKGSAVHAEEAGRRGRPAMHTPLHASVAMR